MEWKWRVLARSATKTSSTVSYAGVEYDVLEHALTPRQIADFDAYADAWAIIHRNLEAALGASGVTDPLEGKTLNGQALSAARSRFESSKQRFFGQLLLSMKLPSLLPAIEDALATDHSVVIQLVSTAEALLDRRLADLSAEDRAEIQLDLSPREIVEDYLDNAFPTRAMESYWDEDGNERSRPMIDEAGNPVHSQEALRIKAETLELLGALPPIVPALDAIISRFGTNAVAEITGRTRRLVTLPDGCQRLESRTANQSLADANAFMGGAKRILVFSDAGGTGRSYHATGLQLEQEGCLTDNLPPIQRWLNRILALPIALQNAVFDEFLGLVEARIDAALKAGTFDAGVETLVSTPYLALASSVRASTVSSGLRSSVSTLALCLHGRQRAASPRSSPIRPGCSCR